MQACPRCGAAWPEGASACFSCGHRPRRPSAWLLLAGLLLVLGLLGAWALTWLAPEPEPITQAEAEALAQRGLDDLLADLASPDGGAVRILTAQLHLDDARPYLAGPVDVTLELEWGRDGTARSLLLAQAGQLPVRIEHWCAPDRFVVDRQGQVAERRPTGDLAACTAPLRDEVAAGAGGGNGTGGEDGGAGNLTLVSARPDGRGATALYEDGEGNLYNASVDARGRILRFGVAGARGTGAVHVGYGAREALEFPTPRVRDALRIEARSGWENETFRWTAYAGESAPLDEFEVRVTDGGRLLARFDPTGPTEQTQNGVLFRFHEDGDRRLGPGDAFELETGLRTDGLEVAVWDEWADRPAGTADAPALPVPALLAALAVAVAAARAVPRADSPASPALTPARPRRGSGPCGRAPGRRASAPRPR